jgi:hypothetical protein
LNTDGVTKVSKLQPLGFCKISDGTLAMLRLAIGLLLRVSLYFRSSFNLSTYSLPPCFFMQSHHLHLPQLLFYPNPKYFLYYRCFFWKYAICNSCFNFKHFGLHPYLVCVLAITLASTYKFGLYYYKQIGMCMNAKLNMILIHVHGWISFMIWVK